MTIEDRLPQIFKRAAYHPSVFLYAWKRKDLDKMFEELTKSNIAIQSVEVILVDGSENFRVIPLNSGQIKNYRHEIEKEKKEEFYDYVERSAKEILELINYWDLEKKVRVDLRNKIWYQFKFSE